MLERNDKSINYSYNVNCCWDYGCSFFQSVSINMFIAITGLKVFKLHV